MINLLPPKEKNILLKERNFRLILLLEIIFLVFLICFILILFEIKIHIASRVNYQKTQLQAETEASAIQELRKKINSANQNIFAMRDFYQKTPDLTGILEKVSGKILPGMYLTSISYNKANSQISLSGFSPTRNILRTFEQSLNVAFEEVDLPKEFLLKDADIDFEIYFKING